MKSNSVFLIFAATVIIAGILLSRIFAKAPAAMAESVEKKTAEAVQMPVATATPTALMNAVPTATPTLPSPTPTPTPAQASASTGANADVGASAKVDPAIEADFLAVATNAISTLPSEAQIQKMSADQVHFTPKQVIDAATEIGRVSEMLEAHPELSSRGLQFYKECAEKDSAESLRATCLADFKKLQKRSGNSGPEPRVPRRIALLADKLSS